MKKIIQNDENIEFCSKKGQGKVVNQDNMFIYSFEDLKIFGIFDGHGPYGHKVSGYAQTKFLQYIKSSTVLTPSNILSSESFPEIRKELIEIFLSIQDELETNYSEYLDQNFPEDNPASSLPLIKEETVVSKQTSSSPPTSPRPLTGSLKRDPRSKGQNITEHFIGSVLMGDEDSGFEDHGYKLDDISLSGTTASIVFQIGKRLIMAYVGDSAAWVGCREKSKRALCLVTSEGEHTPKNIDEKLRIYNFTGEVRQSSVDK